MAKVPWAAPRRSSPPTAAHTMTSFTARIRLLSSSFIAIAACFARGQVDPSANPGQEFNVRAFGATGDGKTLDTDAINKAIEAAAAAGGGTVQFPAGTYLSFSIRLKSHITLHLDQGCVIVAAAEAPGFGAYDPAEPNEWGDKFQSVSYTHLDVYKRQLIGCRAAQLVKGIRRA